MLEERHHSQGSQLFAPEEMARMRAQAQRLQMVTLQSPETAPHDLIQPAPMNIQD